MSIIRLLLIDKNETVSGLIPSASIANVLHAIANGAQSSKELWKIVATTDPTLEAFYKSNLDDEPKLDGTGDGLLVINWQYKCIESFQIYQPLTNITKVRMHTGKYCDTSTDEISFHIDKNTWKLLDYYFEECRHKI